MYRDVIQVIKRDNTQQQTTKYEAKGDKTAIGGQ